MRLLIDKAQNNIVNSAVLLPLIISVSSAITVRILSATYQRLIDLLMCGTHSALLRCLDNCRYQGQMHLKNTSLSAL